MSVASSTSAHVRTLVERSGLDATGCAGEPASSVEYRVDAARTVGMLARALADLHSLEVDPLVDQPLTAADIAGGADAHETVQRDRGEPADAGGSSSRPSRTGAYRHMERSRLAEILVDGAPGIDDRSTRRVLTHGAPTLSQLWCAKGELVGFVGWGRAAVADPYRDLAVAARGIAEEMPPVLLQVFFEQYGLDHPDPIRLDWYSLADELTR